MSRSEKGYLRTFANGFGTGAAITAGAVAVDVATTGGVFSASMMLGPAMSGSVGTMAAIASAPALIGGAVAVGKKAIVDGVGYGYEALKGRSQATRTHRGEVRNADALHRGPTPSADNSLADWRRRSQSSRDDIHDHSMDRDFM